jgi:hypothetical protein
MRKRTWRIPTRMSRESGMTIVELMIGALIFAAVATAGFHFYSRMHMITMGQDSISELQHQGRNTLRDMRKTARMAGFDLTSHIPVRVSGDTLIIHYSLSQPVDTVKYYLDEFTSAQYSNVVNLPTGKKLYRLVKKVNSEAPTLYADYVNDFTVLRPDLKTILLTITIQSERADDKYTENNGYRTYTQGERVYMRNVS